MKHSSTKRSITYCVVHNGCDPLEADAAGVRRDLQQKLGLVLAPVEEADVLVVMGCTFSHQKEAEFNRMLADACSSPNGRLVVASGCFLTRSLSYPNLRYSRRDELLKLVSDSIGRPVLDKPDNGSGSCAASGIVVISEGCYGQCAFCSVKIVRGNHRSRSIDKVISDIGCVVAGGRQVKLAGQDVAAYGRDRGESLWGLLRTIADCYPGLQVELGPMGPEWLIGSNNSDLALLATQNIAGNIHVPLQSASDAVLKRMRRRYTRDEFEKLWGRLCAVGVQNVSTDLMAGFPGETPEDHEDTLAFLGTHRLAFAQIFMYESRPGTEAAKYEVLPKRRRLERTIELIAEYLRAYAEFRGAEIEELVSPSEDMLFNTNIPFEEDITNEG